MEVDDDLRALMLHILDVEKRTVQEELDEYGCANVVLITPSGRMYEEVHFEDEESKIAAYTAVVRKAREEKATAIVTVNAARVSAESYTDDVEGYWWGKLAAENARSCISITVSGPGMKSLALDLAYDIVDGSVRFDSDPEFAETEIGMLPDWPPMQSTLVS